MSQPEVTPLAAKKDVFEGLDPAIKVRTRKMMMWFIILAIVMLFGGITSAMLVIYGKIIWLHITPPTTLWVSNSIIIISSVTLILSLRSLNKGRQQLGLLFHISTLILGVCFTLTQYYGWSEMSDRGLGSYKVETSNGTATHWHNLSAITQEYGSDYWFEMNNERLVKEGAEFYKPSNPSTPVTNTVMTTFNAFGAALFALIILHIIHLSFGLIYLIVNTIRIVKGRINRDNTLSIYISGMYWHFLGGLWLYLFYFLFFLF